MTFDGTAEDVLDSRDLIEYAEDEDSDPDIVAQINELAEIGLEDWEYGAQLIRYDYFESYAQELAEDIGAIPTELDWPLYCIDWEKAADALQMDYTSVEFLGVDYLAR